MAKTMQERVDAMLARTRAQTERFAEEQRRRIEGFERESQEAMDAFSAGRFPEYMETKARIAAQRRKANYNDLMGVPDGEQPNADSGSGGAVGGINTGDFPNAEDGVDS